MTSGVEAAGAAAEAEDVAMEALTRAFVRRDRLHDAPRWEAWALKVMANLAVDHLRRGAPPLIAADPTTAFEAAGVDRLALSEALRRLPRRQRRAHRACSAQRTLLVDAEEGPGRA